MIHATTRCHFTLTHSSRKKSETSHNPTTMSPLIMSAIPEPTPVELAKTVTSFQVLQEKVDTISSLDPIQRSSLLAVLLVHQSVFNELPGRTQKYVHIIKMHDYTPFVKKAYPIAFSLRPEVEKVIQQMLQLGVIKREASPFASPMTVVKKKNGTVRICLDARWIHNKWWLTATHRGLQRTCFIYSSPSCHVVILANPAEPGKHSVHRLSIQRPILHLSSVKNGRRFF
jgi:hypothetical protein